MCQLDSGNRDRSVGERLAGGLAVLQLGPMPLLDNASSLVTRKALGAPTGACPNCWRAGVVVDLSDGSESRWWMEDRVRSFDFIL
jgi:hypothetical protein